MSDQPLAVRYVPVHYRTDPGSRILLKAAIEDRRDEYLIPVANASVAVTLADLMNREDRGETLPESNATKVVPSFTAELGPTFRVIWSNRFSSRVIAHTRSLDDARRIASLLNRINYPVRAGLLLGLQWRAAVRRDKADDLLLEDPTLPPTQTRPPVR